MDTSRSGFVLRLRLALSLLAGVALVIGLLY
jgi:hypothetical protein